MKFLLIVFLIIGNMAIFGEEKSSESLKINEEIKDFYKIKTKKRSRLHLKSRGKYRVNIDGHLYTKIRDLFLEGCYLSISEKTFLYEQELKEFRQEGPISLAKISKDGIFEGKDKWGLFLGFYFKKGKQTLVVHFKHKRSRKNFIKNLLALTPLCQEKSKHLKLKKSLLKSHPVEDLLSFSKDYGNRSFREGDKVHLLLTEEEAFKERMELIAKAKQEIRIQVLTFAADQSGQEMANLLIEKARQGVKVTILMDTYSHLFGLTDLKSWKENFKLYDRMYKAGISLYGYCPPSLWRWPSKEFKTAMNLRDMRPVKNRLHDKYFIVDRTHLIIGGTNVGDVYFGKNPPGLNRWRDQDLEIIRAVPLTQESTIDDAINIFEGNKKTLDDNIYTPEKSPYFVASAVQNELDRPTSLENVKSMIPESLLLQSRPAIGEKNIAEAYLHLIRTAKKEIIISNAYMMPDVETVSALIEASLRNVKIYILSNSQESSDLSPMCHYARYIYKYLVDPTYWSDHRLEIYEWMGKRALDSTAQYGTNHSKFMIVDGKTLVIGSYNLDPRSLMSSSEVVYILQREETALELRNYFFEHDLSYSRKVDYSEILEWHQSFSFLSSVYMKLRGVYPGKTLGQLWKGKLGFEFVLLTKDIW